MPKALAIERARNVFYMGVVFSSFLLLALAFETTLDLLQAKQVRSDLNIKADSAHLIGKTVLERYDCIGCHTLLGEGAYFASELANVYPYYNGNYATIRDLIRSPVNIPGRRIMPRYNLTAQELQALIEFLRYSSTIATVTTTHWSSPQ